MSRPGASRRLAAATAVALLASLFIVLETSGVAVAAPADRVIETVELEFAAEDLPAFGGSGDAIAIKQLVDVGWNESGSAGDIENVDYYLGEADFGGRISASTDGLIQFGIRYRIPETETLDIHLDTEVEFDVPAAGSFFPGDTIRISADHSVTGGTITAPLSGGTLDFPTRFSMAAEGTMRSCVFGCVDQDLFPSFDFDISDPIVTVPDDLGGTSGAELPPGLPGVSGTVGLPNSEPVSVFDAVGLSSGNGGSPSEFVDLNFDLDTWVRTPVPLGAAVNFGPVRSFYDLVDVDIDLTASEIQELDFDPELTVTMPLPEPMAYEVRDGGAVVGSGVADEITFETGQDLYLSIPEDSVDPFEVTPTIGAGGRVDHEVTHRLDVVGSLDILAAGFGLDEIEVFAGTDPAGWVPGGCLPWPFEDTCWDGYYVVPEINPITAGPWGAGFGPMHSESLAAPPQYNPIVDTWFNIEFEDSFTGPTLTLDPENKPTFVAGANITVSEDAGPQLVAGWATGMSAGPTDESGQTLAFTVTTDNNVLFTAPPAVDAASGDLTFTAAPDANGMTTLTVTLADNADFGLDSTAAATLQITVDPVNDAPRFTTDGDVTLLEDAGRQLIAGWADRIVAGPADESGQALTFDVTTDADGMFAVLPTVDPVTGDLEFTPADNANGTVEVTVILTDDGGTARGGVDTSEPTVFTIDVTPVPDAPVATGEAFAIDEDATLEVLPDGVLGNDSDSDNDDLTPVLVEDVRFGSLDLLADGSFVYEPVDDFYGTDTFAYRASDGDLESEAVTVTIDIAPVNDRPMVFADHVSVDENSGTQTIALWATADAGNRFELGQTFAYEISVADPGLFTDLPVVDEHGNLFFTPGPDAYGKTRIEVTVTDSGIGGVDRLTSEPVHYALSINSVDGPPVLDTDGDGIADFDEAQMGLDPNDPDGDDDGINDGDELMLGTDPTVTDWTDVEGHVFRQDVLWAVLNRVTHGCGAGDAREFCPDDPITRGQVAAFFTRAFDLDEDGRDWFSDDDYSLFEDDINALAAAGITRGCGPDSFCPDRYVTRGELAAMLGRALGLSGNAAGFFGDDDGTLFEGDINRLAEAGITSGCGNGNFCPDRPATRGEVVALLHRAVG